ncbi:MAG: immunoglobulin domain-containing protein, partial [Planctomycetes bacterium]|nr:immunoglobulin domain-containing protein [Planctomycetota bacterium]
MPILRLLPLLLACILACAAPLAAADPPLVILDSDMSSDHDDVGDIATLHGLAALGEVRIIGMMVSSKNYGTAQFMDAVNTWYGKPDIPIGIPPDIGGVGEYPGVAVGTGRWPHSMGATKEAGLASGACLWAKDLYRKLLTASPDRSVVIVTTGYLQNVEALMNSAPDAYSALSGIDLVRQKVRLLACAGGDYPSGSEFNFRVGDTTPRPAYRVVNDWPTAAWFISYNMGQSIYTGGLLDQARADSPIRYVYVDSNTEDYPYPSWGQQMVYVAARGLDTFWGGQTTGRNNADTSGSNWWTASPDPAGDQEQGYLLEQVRTPVQESIDALIMLEPNTGAPCRPGQPSNLRATVAGGNRIDLAWRDNAYNESGFVIERGINGTYTQVGSVGANATGFSDTGLASTANIAYRVKAANASGDSRWAQTWVYSGWTEVNLTTPGAGPIYTTYRPCDLRYIDGLTQYEHVILNNDSTHGQNLSIAVDAGAIDNQGVFHVYFLYQNQNNWYRLVYDNRHNQQQFRFEKRIAGSITTVGAPRVLAQTLPVQNSEHALHGIGGGSRLRTWQIQVAPGSLSFQTSERSLADDGTRPVSTIRLDVSETLGLDSGLIGLGSYQQRPMWENFRFTTGATAALSPAIVAHPQSTAVFDGRTATFTVAASGSNPLTYLWRKGTTHVGSDSAILTIAAAHAADAGAYTCTVSNSAGSVTSHAATLMVNAIVAPTITTQPVATVAGVGDSAQFAVVASGTAPLTYQWRRGGTAVGGDSAVLALSGVQAADAGPYTCTVSNSSGTATSNAATLTVVAALDPLIAANALINDGGGTYGGYPNTADKAFDSSTATFYDAAAANAWTGIDVGAAGATVTAIRFIARAGQPGRMVGGVFEGSNSLASGYTTLATVVAASDQVWTTVLVAGAAPCRYLRYRGPTGSACNVAEIEFRGRGGGAAVVAPAITAQPASQTLSVGQSASFTVVASGTAPLTYQWTRNGAVVGGNSATLTIADAQVADMGSYTCTVTNSAGSATSNVALLTVNTAAIGLDPLIPAAAVISDGNGSWGGTANTADKAFDSSTATFYDPSIAAAWTGIDAGSAATVTAIRWWARAGWSARMLGGVFEGAASASGPWTALASVSAASDSAWTTATVSAAAPWRYLRYRCASGAWCNVAEIEFRGRGGGAAVAAPAITT